jgi:hypothetical protein
MTKRLRPLESDVLILASSFRGESKNLILATVSFTSNCSSLQAFVVPAWAGPPESPGQLVNLQPQEPAQNPQEIVVPGLAQLLRSSNLPATAPRVISSVAQAPQRRPALRRRRSRGSPGRGHRDSSRATVDVAVPLPGLP